uniref:Uncharacterized protein n=1 Tax=Rhizophora mucronata TaxID=61149 RepID=A0A2P2NM64_RHIMU
MCRLKSVTYLEDHCNVVGR